MRTQKSQTGTTKVGDFMVVFGCENRTNGLLPLYDDPLPPAHGRLDIMV